MDIKLIHKPDKYNVVLNASICKEECQGEMPWESTKILRAIFVGKSGLETKI